MAVEFSPLGPVATIDDGLAVIGAAGKSRSGLVIDAWNFCFGGSPWDKLGDVPLEKVAYLQFTDALEPISANLADEALNRRAFPGEGTLPLERFVETFRRRNWEGIVSLQVLSSELRQLPLGEFAQRAHDAAARFWQ
jgi:sugar phosphate isomerase/epimerase